MRPNPGTPKTWQEREPFFLRHAFLTECVPLGPRGAQQYLAVTGPELNQLLFDAENIVSAVDLNGGRCPTAAALPRPIVHRGSARESAERAEQEVQ